MSHRERVTYDKLGTPQKTYKSDSWDDSKTVNDLSGAQRSPDALSPAYSEADSVEDQVYYTLGPSGMIDTFMERMEQIKWTDGSKLDGPTDDSISGKMFCPNHGSGSMMWQGGIWLPVMPAPPGLIPPLPGTPKAPEKPKANNPHTEINAPPVRLNPQPMPKGPYPDPDPHFNPKPYYGPGSDRMSADFMGSSAYNNPNFGLPSDGGGSFIGLGRFDSACNIPNDMQPSTPSGGLFGPDFGIGIWGFPGYRTPGGEGIFLPVARRSGPSIPHAIDTSGLPSGRPGLSWPTGFETAIMSGSEYYAKACRWADRKWSEHYQKYGRSPVIWVDIAYCDQHSGPQAEPTKNRDGSPRKPKTGGGTGQSGGDPLSEGLRNGTIERSFGRLIGPGCLSGPLFGYTTSGAEHVAKVNEEVRERRRKRYASKSKEELLEENLRNSTTIEQTDEERNEVFRNAWKNGMYGWWNVAQKVAIAVAVIAGIAAIGLCIFAYYGVLAGADWAMYYSANSWVLRNVAPYFLRRRFLREGAKIYRLYGRNYSSQWWTPLNPNILSNPRNYLSLPPWNTAENLAIEYCYDFTGAKIGYVAPAFGGQGGAIEIVLPCIFP